MCQVENCVLCWRERKLNALPSSTNEFIRIFHCTDSSSAGPHSQRDEDD